MNNLELVTVEKLVLPAIEGVVRGLEIKDKTYYIVADCKLYKVANGTAIHIAPKAKPLLRGLIYNTPDEKLFACDGAQFYYQLDKSNFIEIPCPIEVIAVAYAPTFDKLAYMDMADNIVIGNVGTVDAIFVQDFTCSLHDTPPPSLNVNWGTSETQFSGFNNATQVDVLREAIGLPCTDPVHEIVWRRDGMFFLVTYFAESKRRFKIFSPCSGVVAESEDIPGLHAPIAWRLKHNMIMVSCFSNEKWRLIVFEPTGLARSALSLREQGPVRQLSWSCDDEILAVVQEGESESFITLITVGNYTFEVKQELVFRDQVRYVQWRQSDDSYTQNLVVLLSESVVHYFFRFVVNSSGTFVDGGSTVAVIDDRHIALINFETFIIPPPYKKFEFSNIIGFPNVINQVVFNASKPSFLCVDCYNNYYVYEYGGDKAVISQQSCGNRLPGDESFPLNVHHIGFYDNILVMYIAEEGSEKELRYDLDTLTVLSSMEIKANMTGLKFVKSGLLLQEYVHFKDGELYLNVKRCDFLPSGVQKIEKITSNEVDYMFILCNNGCFSCNGKHVADDVTSFITFNQYILYTTSDNKLMSSRLNVLNTLLFGTKEPSLNFDVRMLEEGGKLIVGVASKLIAILQMPRGNIEVISTDLLAIDLVDKFLISNHWQEAVNEAKLRQLNLNVLVDLDIERFISNIEKFLDSIAVANLVDFILDLTEYNIIPKMSCRFQFSSMTDVPLKLDKVHSKLLETMEILCLGQYIEPVLIVRVKTLGMQEAMNYAHLLHSCRDPEIKIILERGLLAVVQYFPSEEILKASLRTYDLDFAMFVHFFYKQDPQITSMLMNNFSNSFSENEKRFKINNYIGDTKTATVYFAMYKLEGEEQNIPRDVLLDPVVDYAQTNEHLETLYLFLRENNISLPRLCYELGHYLDAVNRKSEAADIYVEGGELDSALELYISEFQWKKALEVITSMNLDPDEEMRRLEMLADHFDALSSYTAAITIYLNLHLHSKAIDSCIHGHSYHEALMLAREHDPTLIDYVRVHLNDYVSNLEDLFYSSKVIVGNFADRIETIWEQRIAAAKTPIAVAESSGYDPILDLAESVNTGASTSKSSGTNTTKRSRREQRRYADLKEGGQYEDIAIMRAAYNKITELSKLKPEIDSHILALREFREFFRAKCLAVCFNDMLIVFQTATARIWFSGLTSTVEDITLKVTVAQKNFDFIDEKYLQPPKLEETIDES